jgi:hypothetical protein
MLKAEEWDRLAAAIGTATSVAATAAVAAAYERLIELAILEANDYGTHPDTPEEKRAGWCGRERGLRDLLREIEQLRSGDYRNWPGYRAEKQQAEQPRREDAKEDGEE